MNLLSVFFTTFSFCVIFIMEVYTVLIKVYTVFFGKKWVALKSAGCWVAVKKNRLLIITLSEKVSKTYNFGCIVTAVISFIK